MLVRVICFCCAFLGLSVLCVVCQDINFDPLTLSDFYSLTAFFNNIDATPETGRRSGTDFLRGLQPPYINLTNPQQEADLSRLEAEVEAARAELSKRQAALRQVQKAAKVKKAEKAAGDDVEANQRSSDNAGVQATAKVAVEEAEKRLKAAQRARDDYLITIPAAMVMKERSEVRPAHILIRGAYDNPGEQVDRATPAFLPPMRDEDGQPNRMDLANWLVDPSHPLTSRVTVNRFWQQFSGVGIVRTAEDFGAQGEWPSHPDLLDYLAVRFVDSGWNVRQLLKEIVLSETYQQSSFATPEDYQNDPDNRLLARGSRFRMDSELIRDQVLATSGLLSRKLYGKSVKPPQPEGLWTAVGMPSSYPREFKPDSGDKIYRRSVYTFWKRGMPPPQMTILNAPSREECIARRERTNTPLQALLLLNEEEYLKAARHLASSVLKEKIQSDRAARINAIYETITGYVPSVAERKAFEQLVTDLESIYEESPELAAELCGEQTFPAEVTPARCAAWTMLTSTIYNLDITKTRQ